MIMYKICLKISMIQNSGIVICFIILPYLRRFVLWMNYLSRAIDIPTTHETIYLVSDQGRFSDGIRSKITKCGWRIYNSFEKEYLYYDYDDYYNYNNRHGPIIPIYYKVSKYTLYIVSRYSFDPPSENIMRTKIVQINQRDYFRDDGFHWWERSNFGPKEEQIYFEVKGFSRFP